MRRRQQKHDGAAARRKPDENQPQMADTRRMGAGTEPNGEVKGIKGDMEGQKRTHVTRKPEGGTAELRLARRNHTTVS